MSETTELLAKLKKIDAEMVEAPWAVCAVSAAIRHVQRNTDIMEYAIDGAEGADRMANLPGRYDGGPLAELRNLLPEIIAALTPTQGPTR